MKHLKIIIAFFTVLSLFGCSQKHGLSKPYTHSITNIHTELTSEVYAEHSITVDNQSDINTTKPNFIQSQNTTKFQATKPEATSNFVSSTKYVHSNDNLDVITYRKKGDILYIDDQRYHEKQNNIQGIALIDYFLSEEKSIEKISVSFLYDNISWKIVSSKGIYGYNLIGSETAIMTLNEETYCVPNSNSRPKIQIEVFDKNSNSILKTDYTTRWWANGFVKGNIDNPNEIRVKNRITFKSEEMAASFASQLEGQGLTAAQSEQTLMTNTYYVQGSDAWYVF